MMFSKCKEHIFSKQKESDKDQDTSKYGGVAKKRNTGLGEGEGMGEAAVVKRAAFYHAIPHHTHHTTLKHVRSGIWDSEQSHPRR